MSLVRVEPQRLRECLCMEDCRALSAAPVARHDEEVVRTGLNRHVRGLEVVTLIATGEKHLTYRYAVSVEHQDPALAVHCNI